MDEEILMLDSDVISVPQFLFKRKGDQLIVANKGCLSIVGIIYPYKSSFLILGSEEIFPTEDAAVEFLCRC